MTRRQHNKQMLLEELRIKRALRRGLQFDLVERAWILVVFSAAIAFALIGELPSAGGGAGTGVAVVILRMGSSLRDAARSPAQSPDA